MQASNLLSSPTRTTNRHASLTGSKRLLIDQPSGRDFASRLDDLRSGPKVEVRDAGRADSEPKSRTEDSRSAKVDESRGVEDAARPERVRESQKTDNEENAATDEKATKPLDAAEATDADAAADGDQGETASDDQAAPQPKDDADSATDLALMQVLAATPSQPVASQESAVPAEETESNPATIAAVATVATAVAMQQIDEAEAEALANPNQPLNPDGVGPDGKPLTQVDKLAAQMKPANEAADNLDLAAGTRQANAETSDDRGSSSNGGSSQQQHQPPAQEAAALATPDAGSSAVETKAKEVVAKFDETLAKLAGTDAAQQPTATRTDTKALPALPPEQQFARDNLDNLVTSVRTQATTSASGAAGGQMHIRLDPPELGALEVAVKMVEGRMTASFTTNNDNATQLLSHNLNNLKASLEATGVQVDRIQVKQASNDGNAQSQTGSDGRSQDGRNGTAYDTNGQQSNQQRKEAVERMWRRFAYGSDDLDLVA